MRVAMYSGMLCVCDQRTVLGDAASRSCVFASDRCVRCVRCVFACGVCVCVCVCVCDQYVCVRVCLRARARVRASMCAVCALCLRVVMRVVCVCVTLCVRARSRSGVRCVRCVFASDRCVSCVCVFA